VAAYLSVMGLSLEEVKAQVKTQTQEDICAAFKYCATNGCVLYYDHKPWFKIAFEKLPFTENEKKKRFERLCNYTDKMYFSVDKTVYQIVQDADLNTTEKKLLVLRLIGEPIPANLEPYWKKHQLYLKNTTIRTIDDANRSKVTQYIDDEYEQAKKENEQAKKENAVAKKWLELLKAIQWE